MFYILLLYSEKKEEKKNPESISKNALSPAVTKPNENLQEICLRSNNSPGDERFLHFSAKREATKVDTSVKSNACRNLKFLFLFQVEKMIAFTLNYEFNTSN